MRFSDAPFFVAPYRDLPGGVDFLGLRQVNLDLMYQFLPGINNVTTYLRPYSVMTWFAWAFHEDMKRRGIEESTRKEYDAYREKVELLFGWGQQLQPTKRGMVGSTSKAPSVFSGRVPLTFEAWKRNVSWLDAVNYGPSLKMDNGLGFLAPVKPGIFAVSSRGEELARALDEQLCGRAGYSELRNQELGATEDIARSLHVGWNIDMPSPKEQTIMRSALYDPAQVGGDKMIGLRSSAIRLIEIALQSSGRPMRVDEVRRCLAVGLSPYGSLLAIPENLIRHHHRWVVLQVRQSQRLAMEGFFAWIERQVVIHGVRDSHSLAMRAAELFANHEWFDGLQRPSQALSRIESRAAGEARPLWNGSAESSRDMFAVWAKLQEAINKDSEHICPLAMWLLLLNVAISDELCAMGVGKEFLDWGGASRVSLKQWAHHVRKQAERSFGEFLLSFIETFMLSQHFGTATRRYETGKQRLRLTIEEGGLTPMISTREFWYPAPAPDRIEAMMTLMADCGMLSFGDDGYAMPA